MTTLPPITELEPPGGTPDERRRIEEIWRAANDRPASSSLVGSHADWVFLTALLRSPR